MAKAKKSNVRVKRVSVRGAKQIKANLLEIARGLSGEDRSQLAMDVSKALGDAARIVTEEAKRNVAARGLDPNIAKAVFVFDKPGTTRRGSANAALIGVRKGSTSPAYVEWKAATGPGTTKSLDGSREIVRKVEKGGLVGMSTATMAELGTSNRMPTPFWAPALKTKSRELRKVMAANLKAVLDKWTPPPSSPEAD